MQPDVHHAEHPDGFVTVTADASGALVRLKACPEPLPDAALNAMRSTLVAALATRPAHIVFDLTACTTPDSRVVALTCDAIRLCLDQRVPLRIRASRTLRTWLVVYRIPGLRRVFQTSGSRADGDLPAKSSRRRPSSNPRRSQAPK